MDEACSKIFSQCTVGCCKICQKCTNVHVTCFSFFFLTCWLCRLFCRVKAFSSLFSPSKIKKDLSLSCTFPQSHTSLGCQFSAQGVRLQLLLFCNGYYYFKWCAFILTSWEDLMFQGYMHFWIYTMPVVQEELLPFNPSLYEYLSPLTAESKLSEREGSQSSRSTNWVKFVFLTEQLLYSLYNWVSIRHISHSLKIAYIIVWTCSKLDFIT